MESIWWDQAHSGKSKGMTEASDFALQYAIFIACYVQDKVREVSMDAILDLNLKKN